MKYIAPTTRLDAGHSEYWPFEGR